MLPVPRVLLVYLLEGKLPCDFAWPLPALVGQENHFLSSQSRRSCSSFRPVLSPFIRVGIPPGTPELRNSVRCVFCLGTCEVGPESLHL